MNLSTNSPTRLTQDAPKPTIRSGASLVDYLADRCFDNDVDPRDLPPERIKDTDRIYTRLDIQAAEQRGREAGYQAGFAEARQKEQEALTAAYGKLEQQLKTIQQGLGQQVDALRTQTARLISLSLAKLFPAMSQQLATLELERVIQQVMTDRLREPTLTIRLNPTTAQLMRDVLPKLQHITGFRGQIELQEAPALGASDCQIDWAFGGFDQHSEVVFERVQQLIQSTFQLPPIAAHTSPTHTSVKTPSIEASAPAVQLSDAATLASLNQQSTEQMGDPS